METNGVVDATLNSHSLDRSGWDSTLSLIHFGENQFNAGDDSFVIAPDPQQIPLVFKYTQKTGTDAKFTTMASYFTNAALLASPNLRLVWRVSFQADEQDIINVSIQISKRPNPIL